MSEENWQVLFETKYDYEIACIGYTRRLCERALTTPTSISSAFTWSRTKQGRGFWESFSDGGNQEEGRALLRAFLNVKKVTLEDEHHLSPPINCGDNIIMQGLPV